MELTAYIIIALKIIISLSILTVWLLQAHKPTKWRGGANTESLIKEFEAYGLSRQFCYFIGFLKISLAIILLASIKFEFLTLIGSAGLVVLLVGSLIMHIKVKDPLYKSFPAFLFIILNLLIIYNAL